MEKPDSHPLFKTGDILDEKWVLIERIGKGGMGEVYRAHQLNLNRDVAIKIISEELLESFEDNPEEKAAMLERLHREVQTMAQVRHANILQIYDFGTYQARKRDKVIPVQYIAMEYIPGNTLRFTMSEDGFGDEVELLRDWLTTYFLPVLEGVTAIHQKGIVHRDMKPENVLMDGDIPKIADFGLARSVRMRAISNSWDVKGSMNYMAPEQFMDFRKVGPPADIYSLGKILFEAVEGKIESKTIPLKSVKLKETANPFLEKIDAIVQKATHEDSVKRYQSVEELTLAIKAVLDNFKYLTDNQADAKMPPQRTNIHVWTRFGAGFVFIALIAMTLWHLLGNPGFFNRSNDEAAIREVSPVTSQSQSGPDTLKNDIRGKDARKMILIESEATQMSAEPSPAPFYIDREKVTNHHFLEFLNELKDQLNVSDGVVRNGDQIWVYLGSGTAPYEQILYRDGRFHLREAAYAPKPVVRVTFYGAHAYASHYDKRLPTAAEWRTAAGWLRERMPVNFSSSAVDEPLPSQNAHSQMMGQSNTPDSSSLTHSGNSVQSVVSMPLIDLGMQLKEWTGEYKSSASGPRARVIDWASTIAEEPPVGRSPWEGFEDVGFRTILPLK